MDLTNNTVLELTDYRKDLTNSLSLMNKKMDIVEVALDYDFRYVIWKEPVNLLTDYEREYLKNILEPYRENIKFICKCEDEMTGDFLYIEATVNHTITIPIYESELTYSGLEYDKRYSSEELGL